MRKLITIIVSVLLWMPLPAETLRLRVDSQETFDRLGETLREALQGSAGTVEVHLAPGCYFFRERHLDLDSIDAPGKNVRVFGEGAVIYPALNQSSFVPDATHFRPEGDSLGVFAPPAPIRHASFLVWVVNRKEKICRIKVDEALDSVALEGGYIYLTQWFRGRTYPVVDIKGKHLYFKAEDLKQQRFLYSVNTDWTFSMQYPRYRLINCKSEYAGALQATACTFVSLHDACLDSFQIEGVRFVGNRRLAESPDDALFLLTGTSAAVRVEHCRFEWVQSDCFLAHDMTGLTVRNCLFSHCGRRCVFAGNNTADVHLLSNRVDVSGTGGSNVNAFESYGRHFRIAGNEISDFGYGAIRTGIHYAADKPYEVSGVIQDNLIYQSESYFKASKEELLMDSGAIYIATRCDSVVIRRNVIHHIDGPTYNRGIFADDGASHFQIYDNHISHIGYFCIDIDPKSAWKMLHRKERKVDYAHKDILVEGNQVDGEIRIPKP